MAQVEEAPVHALVEARVGGDRGLGVRLGDHLERVDLHLEAAELHALVVLELAGDGDERAVRERRDRLGRRQASGCLGVGALVDLARRGVHELHGARLVAKDDELHLLLIAHGLDPSGHGDGAVGRGGEVLDEGAVDHDPTSYPWGFQPAAGATARQRRIETHTAAVESGRRYGGRRGGGARMQQADHRVPIDAQQVDAPLSLFAVFLVVTIRPDPTDLAAVRGVARRARRPREDRRVPRYGCEPLVRRRHRLRSMGSPRPRRAPGRAAARSSTSPPAGHRAPSTPGRPALPHPRRPGRPLLRVRAAAARRARRFRSRSSTR